MTDIERIKVFEEKKQETIDKLIGKDVSYPMPEVVEHKTVDVNWNKNKSWHNDIRLNSNPNPRNTFDQTIYQFMLRNNGGVVVSVSDDTLSEEAPVIK